MLTCGEVKVCSGQTYIHRSTTHSGWYCCLQGCGGLNDEGVVLGMARIQCDMTIVPFRVDDPAAIHRMIQLCFRSGELKPKCHSTLNDMIQYLFLKCDSALPSTVNKILPSI